MMKAAVSEIYATLQGEGPYTGEPQIFVRLAGCPLRCDYCDTPSSLSARGHPLLTVSEVMKQVQNLARAEGIKVVSLTGGEPLAHVGFLKPLLVALKKAGLKTYLETAGVHARELATVIKWVDVVSMDIKLPSATGRKFWVEHEKFLAVAEGKAFVKVVIERHSTNAELERVYEILAAAPDTPLLILQPVTPQVPAIKSVSKKRLDGFLRSAQKRLPQVIVRPQQHKIWGIR